MDVEVEIVSIGDEVLSGSTINSNSAFLSQHLYGMGFLVSRHTVVSDSPSQIYSGVAEAISRAALVIVTGGLGPTHDDLTKEIVSQLMNAPLIQDMAIYRDLIGRFPGSTEMAKNQSLVPKKALIFRNTVGTAPALVFEGDNKPIALILLPGVPAEMRCFFKHDLIPYLGKRFQGHGPRVTRAMHFCLLSENVIDPILGAFPQITTGIYPHFGHVTVRMQAENQKVLDPLIAALKAHFESYIFDAEDGAIEQAVQSLLVVQGKTLALAESCTGGRISALITRHSGASNYFLGGVTAYANRAKKELLGVSADLLETHGAVSKETALAMLSGVFNRFDSDYGIAITGIAGPTGGSPDKPIGTIWVAMGSREGPHFVGNLNFTGGPSAGAREKLILKSANYALGHLYRYLAFGTTPFTPG